jgi:CRP-like cAMP-binding protein
MPAHSKEEVFLARREKRVLDASQEEDLHQLLTRTELFRSLSAKEFKEVFPKMHKRNLAEGEELYRQDEEGQSMFVCLEGLLTSSVTMPWQKDIGVETYRAGQHFGEGNILSDISRISTVIASTDVLVYEIDREDLAPMLEKHTDLQTQLEQGADKQAKKIKEKEEAAIRKRKSNSKPEKKSPIKSIQTFFTSIFEQTEKEKDKGEDDN